MSLWRKKPLKPSRGTQFPPKVREAIRQRDRTCVGPRLGFPGECVGETQADHVRASHGIGMKSRSTEDNGALLCAGHHQWKTEHGREARPMLLDYLAQFYGVAA